MSEIDAMAEQLDEAHALLDEAHAEIGRLWGEIGRLRSALETCRELRKWDKWDSRKWWSVDKP